MSWKRGPFAALALCVLLMAGAAGCGTSDAREQGNGNSSSSAVGELLEDTDEAGGVLREVDREDAPGVRVEVQPDSGDSWDVRLTVTGFRFSPPDAEAKAVAGRGQARLYLDGRLIATLTGPEHHLPGSLVPRGTHHVTARLYADDGTVWAVDGKPVESTADITASKASPTTSSGAAGARTETTSARATGPRPQTRSARPAGARAETMSAQATGARTEGQGSPHSAGKAS
ncbi:nuclear transport factor 2 family protein [Streptomyces sp. NPDC000983]|uniref:nuclear transport factor 2 family protein n=1 Tax=Streptomyces sp. NPDC000983 TaxID=3154373 RepID=UPI00331EB705